LRSSLKLFEIRGIPVEVNASWFIAFAIITWAFSTNLFPSSYRFWSTEQYWIAGAVTTLLLFASVLLHELGHSFVALSQGLKVRGITLLLFGGISRIEGDATRPRNEFFIAFAGPVVSLIIGVVLVGWWSVFVADSDATATPLHGVLFMTGWMNIVVAAFNLLPGYPLDGGRVLRSAVWGISGSARTGSRVAFVVGSGVFYMLIAWGGWRIINGEAYGGIWIVFIGWFLLSAARSERAAQNNIANATTRAELGFNVGMAARPMPSMVEADTTVSEMRVGGYQSESQDSVAVARNGELIGFVAMRELNDVPVEHRNAMLLGQLVDRTSLQVISSYESAQDGLRAMDRHRVDQLVVIDAGHVVGIVTRQDIHARMIEFSSATGSTTDI
jgi:Zn-dependent protease